MVDYFLIQTFYNLVTTICLGIWIAVLWADGNHPLKHKEGWSTFGLIFLGFLFSFGNQLLFYHTTGKLNTNTEKLLVYVGVGYNIIFDMAFFNVFPSVLQILGTILIVGTNIGLISYNIYLKNEIERKAKLE